jgi:hypothetical protein
MAVSQKIKSGDDQPKGGRAIVGIGGARGLAAADVVDANHTLDPQVASSNVDQSIANIDASLDSRYDDPRYYQGDDIT